MHSRQRRSLAARLYHPKVVLLVVGLALSPAMWGMIQDNVNQSRDQEKFLVSGKTIDLQPQPDYLPKSFLADILRNAELDEQVSLFTPGLAETLGHAFERSPWVMGIQSIQLKHPNQIEIKLHYRSPIAMVRMERGYYPVDRDSVLLPPGDFVGSQIHQFPHITGVATSPQGPSGTPWGDVSVLAATRLAEFLCPEGDRNRYWVPLQLQQIRLPSNSTNQQLLSDISLTLITESGSQILWGMAPGVEDAAEPNAQLKLERLLQYLQDYGSLESQQGPIELDLKRWREVARRPLRSPAR